MTSQTTAVEETKNETETIEHFFRVYIASSKHEEGWEISRQLCKSRDAVEGLNNFRELSQPYECFDEAL